MFPLSEQYELSGHGDGDPLTTNYCNSLLACFLWVFHEGLLADAGTALASITDPDATLQVVSPGRLLFDLLFFATVTIALLNMVFGIMIDTFSGLREAQQERDDRLNNTCFICHEHRSEFGEGGSRLLKFGEHIKQEHNISAYILYIAHLYEKDATEHNGLESFVFDQVEQEVTSWLPHKSHLAKASDGREQGLAAAQEAVVSQLGARLDTEMLDVKAQLGGMSTKLDQLDGMAAKIDQLMALLGDKRRESESDPSGTTGSKLIGVADV